VPTQTPQVLGIIADGVYPRLLADSARKVALEKSLPRHSQPKPIQRSRNVLM
jgi:hypothetical protein